MKLNKKNGVWAFALLLVTSVLGLVMSCTMGIGDTKPYLYGRKGGNAPTPPAPSPVEEPDIPVVPDAKDPFKDGEHNKIDYKFDGSKISEYVFKASFNAQKVPVYSFVKNGKSWNKGDQSKNEYTYDGTNDGNTAQGAGLNVTINPAKFYRYDGYNPLSGWKNERMQRFQFYRLEGKAVIPLNNYLIAVDTYSKFIFAYGKITATGSTLGNEYPTAFGPVESYNQKRPFYEYDPIGFLSKSGDNITVTLYQEYQQEMAKDANAFFPQVHDIMRKQAEQTNANTPGCSPYLPKADDAKAIKITVTAKNVKNINMVSKNAGVIWDSSESSAYFINVMRAGVYSTGEEVSMEKLVMTFDQYEKYGTTSIYAAETIKPGQTIERNKTHTFNSILIEEGKDVFVDLDTRIYVSAVKLGFVDDALNDPIAISDYGKPVVKFKYDKEKDTLNFLESTDGTPTGGFDNNGNAKDFNKTWSVERGKTKAITLGFAKTTEGWYVQGVKAKTQAQAKCEVTYEIKFEIVE